MAKNMSFALTTEQIKNRSKTVTRRLGWNNLKPGQRLWAVKKAMGLKPGEKIKRLALIEVVSLRTEPLNAITEDDIKKEGFAEMSKQEFIEFFIKTHKGVNAETPINRIEFKFIGAENINLYFQCRVNDCKHVCAENELVKKLNPDKSPSPSLPVYDISCPVCGQTDFSAYEIF